MSGPAGDGDGFFALMRALAAFKAGPLGRDPSDRALARAAQVAPQTVGDWLRGAQFPQDAEKMLVVVRAVAARAAARGVAVPVASDGARLLDEDRWRAAYRAEAQRRADVVSAAVRAADARAVLAGLTAGWSGAERVRDVVPVRLGVHRSITLFSDEAGTRTGGLTCYVQRDADTEDGELWKAVKDAAEGGGFVVVTGDSSVGKTRSLYEVVRKQFPDWWLLHPRDAEQINEIASKLSGAQRIVLWLDELQRYFGGERGLTAATIRDLLNAKHVLVGTISAGHRLEYTTGPPRNGPDPIANERAILGDLATVVRLEGEFTQAEHQRAQKLAETAPSIRRALAAAADYGLTQTMAAAPQLITCWTDADPYAKAVMNAAIDAARFGVRCPVPGGWLRAAAPGYCTDRQRAAPPRNWFQTALDYATTPLHGTVQALGEVALAGTTMGEASGYAVADYLLEYASHQRAGLSGPTSLWENLADHVTDPDDLDRLAAAAHEQGFLRLAAVLCKRAVLAGHAHAPRDLLLTFIGEPPTGWIAQHASIHDPGALAWLLDSLDEIGADDAVTTLLERILASPGRIALDDPEAVSSLLYQVRRMGMVKIANLLDSRPVPPQLREAASAAARVLRGRAAEQVPLQAVDAVGFLLSELHESGEPDARNAFDLLCSRLVASPCLQDPRAVSTLLFNLHKVGAQDVFTALCDQAASQTLLNDPGGVASLLKRFRDTHAETAAAVLLGPSSGRARRCHRSRCRRSFAGCPA